jgi:hypothetical protein
MPYGVNMAPFAQEDLTSAISGGAQSARRLLTETFGDRLPRLQAA